MSNIPFYVPVLRDKGAWIDWRGRYPGGYGWRGDRPLSAVKKIVIHHTVTNPSGNAATDIDYIKRIHVDGNKWGGIGYHIIISSEVVNGYAKAAYVGDLGSIRAHAPDMKGKYVKAGTGNYYYIGISIIGQLHKVPPMPEQVRTLHEICKELIYAEDHRLPQLGNWQNSIIGHRDVDSTSCPGDKWNYLNDTINPPLDQQIMEEIQRLKNELSAMTTDRNKWKTEAQQKQTQIEAIQTQLSQLQTQVDQLAGNLGAETAKRQELEKKIQNVTKQFEVDSIEQVYSKYQEEVQRVEKIKEDPAYKVAAFLLALIPERFRKSGEAVN